MLYYRTGHRTPCHHSACRDLTLKYSCKQIKMFILPKYVPRENFSITLGVVVSKEKLIMQMLRDHDNTSVIFVC